MPPKGGNAKKESGRAKKEENETKKKEATAAVKAQAEDSEWDKGAKSSKAKEDKEAKEAAEAARKAENARLLAEEEASLPAKKAAPKKKAAPTKPKPAGPGAIAAGGLPSTSALENESKVTSGTTSRAGDEPVESFAATGLDNALDMLSLVNAKSDKASVGQDASKLEAHPERRFKAAFEAYMENELPEARKEHPGLRLQQYRDLLYKQFQKHPDNPFNQTTVSYDASKDEKVAALKAERTRLEERLREKKGS